MANKSLIRETHDAVIILKATVDNDLPKLWKAVLGLYAVWGSIGVVFAGTLIHAAFGGR